MNRFMKFLSVTLAVSLWMSGLARADHKVETVEGLPEGVSKDVATVIDAKGLKVTSDGAAVCSIWFAKEVPTKSNFKPSLSVKYPFQAGELVGVLQVQAKSKYTDFRGQEMKAGVYTLRYGQQPEDGNHIGTSDLADFLLAIPVATDSDPKPIGGAEALSQKSAKSAGSTHPAIFSLLPVDKSSEKPAVQHDSGKGLTILSSQIAAKGGSKVPVRIVVAGKSGE